MRGGKHIYTNSNTFEFMNDLNRAVASAVKENKKYAILPEAAAEAERDKTIFIVQKVSAARLAEGFVPLEDSDYHEVMSYLRTHFTKFQETRFFELYR